MDRKRILEEGLLESYLLGTLDKQEEKKLLETLEKDEWLRRELSELEKEFELLGFENAITPPPKVRDQLIHKLSLETAVSERPPRDKKSENGLFSSGRLLVAASMAAVFALGAFWFYRQWQSTVGDFENLQQQTVVLQERLDILEQRYQNTQTRYTSISKPGIIPLYLVGNEQSPGSSVIAYINHQEKTVIVNSSGLKPLEAGKTYQMWADVEGEMINMGLLPSSEDYIPLRYIDKAESLNITVEPAGGSEHPTVENLISNIYL